MKNLFNDIWERLLFFFLVTLLTVLVIGMVSDHEVDHYYLASSSHGQLKIYLDIDWQSDRAIELDRNVTYSEAIDMVEKLNKTLK